MLNKKLIKKLWIFIILMEKIKIEFMKIFIFLIH